MMIEQNFVTRRVPFFGLRPKTVADDYYSSVAV
jgi:hypothetical protein